MAYGDFSLSFLNEEQLNTSEFDAAVFRQLQSPNNAPGLIPGLPRIRTPRLSASGSGQHSPVFPPPSAEYRALPLPAAPTPRRPNRRRPNPDPTPSETQNAREVLDRTMTKFWFERNAEKALAAVTKEQTAARLADLRKHQESLEATEWMYTPVDALIGQF